MPYTAQVTTSPVTNTTSQAHEPHYFCLLVHLNFTFSIICLL